MSAYQNRNNSQWITQSRVATRLRVGRRTLATMARELGLTTRQLPGSNRIEFLAEEIDRIERESIGTAESVYPVQSGDPAPVQATRQPAGV